MRSLLRSTLRDKPTQKTRIYWPPSWLRASMGMFTSVIVPGYLQFTGLPYPSLRTGSQDEMRACIDD